MTVTGLQWYLVYSDLNCRESEIITVLLSAYWGDRRTYANNNADF